MRQRLDIREPQLNEVGNGKRPGPRNVPQRIPARIAVLIGVGQGADAHAIEYHPHDSRKGPHKRISTPQPVVILSGVPPHPSGIASSQFPTGCGVEESLFDFFPNQFPPSMPDCFLKRTSTSLPVFEGTALQVLSFRAKRGICFSNLSTRQPHYDLPLPFTRTYNFVFRLSPKFRLCRTLWRSVSARESP